MTRPSRPTTFGDATFEVQAQVARLAELGVLTSALLHELRQPLFAAKATAELAVLAGSPEAERWQRVISRLEAVEILVDRFGGLGRPGEPARRLDVHAPILDAVDMLEHRIRQLDAQVCVELCEGALSVHVEESALRQVVLNLVQNALDAVEGRPERNVRVRTTRDAGFATVVVEDSGCGIPQDVLDRIFEPFVTSKPVGRGTGLGLYITRVLVHQAGGVVQLASRTDDGTVVRVALPLDPDPSLEVP